MTRAAMISLQAQDALARQKTTRSCYQPLLWIFLQAVPLAKIAAEAWAYWLSWPKVLAITPEQQRCKSRIKPLLSRKAVCAK